MAGRRRGRAACGRAYAIGRLTRSSGGQNKLSMLSRGEHPYLVLPTKRVETERIAANPPGGRGLLAGRGMPAGSD